MDKEGRKSILRYFLTGFAMGSADIVPGVSGGTIAFIAGIYEKLIASIKFLSQDVLKLVLQLDLRRAFAVIPYRFLIPLGLGILAAVFTLAQGLSFALETYPVFLWSFFFGLIVGSIMIVRKRIAVWTIKDVITLTAAAAVAYGIVGLVPVETPPTLPAFFLAGSVAITAMILPGISGSFMLLIMGKYPQILEAVTELNIVVLGTFLGGAALGLAVFAHILSWLFEHYHDIMIAVLTGLMVGSLRKIWPWKETVTSFVDRHGDVVPLVQKNVLPPSYGPEFFYAVLLAGVGFMVILGIEKYTPEEHDEFSA